MHRKLALCLLALACLVALPLLAAPEAAEAPADQAVEAAPVAPEAEAPAEIDVEGLFDNQPQEMACTQSSCDNYCKTNYGPHSFGFCSGGVCYCAI